MTAEMEIRLKQSTDIINGQRAHIARLEQRSGDAKSPALTRQEKLIKILQALISSQNECIAALLGLASCK